MNSLDDKLRKIFTHERPFGPTNASNITDDAVFKEILDESNRIYESHSNSSASIIIGRRGSGKTSFMRRFRKKVIAEELTTATSFSEVINLIKQHGDCQFYETVADIWEQFIYLAVFRGIAGKYKTPTKDVAILKDFNAKHGIKDGGNLDQILWKIVHLACASELKAVAAPSAFISELAGVDFPTAKASLVNILDSNKGMAVLLIDSVEKYPFHAEKIEYAIGGLLQCVGEFNERNDCVHVRLDLPAELYHVFKKYAPNPAKNFSNAVTLHWHASELLSIAAHRLSIYIRLYYPGYWASLPSSIVDNPQSFMELVLPKVITNRIGTSEDTIPYILRHTQLMPRHMLRYLNSIFGPVYRDNADETALKISEDAVKNGIRHAEDNLSLEVFSAYADIYPMLEAVCEDCIPRLSLKFSDGYLSTVYNQHGKKRVYSGSYAEFKRMLIEAAVIGTLDKETSRYYTANFEYTASDKLMDNGGPYCLHPIFAERYRSIRTGADSNKPVYPFGSDPNAADYRELGEG